MPLSLVGIVTLESSPDCFGRQGYSDRSGQEEKSGLWPATEFDCKKVGMRPAGAYTRNVVTRHASTMSGYNRVPADYPILRAQICPSIERPGSCHTAKVVWQPHTNTPGKLIG